MVRATPQEGHTLEGMMDCQTPEQIDSVLMWEPPSGQQLVILGLEELHGLDRSSVYRVLEAHKPRL